MRARRNFVLMLVLIQVVFVTNGWAQNASGYTKVNVENSGSVKGRIIYIGKVSELKAIPVMKDASVCGKIERFDESLSIDPETKGIKNAVVYLKDIHSGKSWSLPESGLSIDQKGCLFSPRVLLVPVGEKISILNNDGILHNFHTHGKANPPRNMAQPQFIKKLTISFQKPEFIKVNCDIHSWMRAWIVAAEHPYYAVTDESGSFRIDEIPPGTYTLALWHETMSQKDEPIIVKPNEVTEIELTYQMK